MKYKCLILDHDDTVVDSTQTIHYPSFIKALLKLRPERANMSLAEFVGYCFNPGFPELCLEILKFSSEELEYQQKIWKEFTHKCQPSFF